MFAANHYIAETIAGLLFCGMQLYLGLPDVYSQLSYDVDLFYHC